jgi:integrase
VLSASLGQAVDDGLIARNPCDTVKLPPVRKRRQLFLSAPQVSALAEAAEARQDGAGTLVLLLAYSGLRWGEAVALRPSSIDIGRRRVSVTEAYSEVNGKLNLGTPKTHETRTVIIPSFLATMLDDYLEARFGTDVIDLFFPAPGGGPHRSSSFRRSVWLPAVEAAEWVPKGLLVHDLRDTAASLAISAGASIKAVQRMLGHASAAMTLDTYGSLFEDDLEDLADRMGETYGEAAGAANVVSLPVARSGS